MSNYTQVTFFTPKDSLPTNSPQKTIFGAAYDVEFGNISTAIASKPDNTTTASFLNVNVTGSTLPQNGIYLPSANTLGFTTNATQVGTISSAGVWTFNAPSAGTSTFVGPSGNYGLTINNNGTSGNSLGLQILAGTTSADAALAVLNKGGGTIFFEVFGNGETFVAPPTAGTDRSGSPLFQVGYLDIPQNSQGVNYATIMSDRGKAIQHNSASAHTFTINDATVNYPVGTTIMIINPLTNGVVTIALQTTANNLVWSPSGAQGNRTLAAAGQATVMKYAAGTPGVWQIAGTGLT